MEFSFQKVFHTFEEEYFFPIIDPFKISSINYIYNFIQPHLDFNTYESEELFSSSSILVPDFNNNSINESFENTLISGNNINLRSNIEDKYTINLEMEDNKEKSTFYETKFRLSENTNFNDLDYDENYNIELNEPRFEPQIIKIDESNKTKEKELKLFKVTPYKRKRNNPFKRKSQFSRLYDEDNINTKLKINFTECNRIIVNSILEAKLKQIGREKDLKDNDFQFLKIDHKQKRKMSKKEIELFQKNTIEDYIKSNVSSKFSTKSTQLNEKICEKIRKDESLKVVSEVLEKNCLFFFDKIYLQKKRYNFNLNEFDFKEDLEFKLPKKKIFYEDLLEKNKKLEYFEKYKTTMDICCRKYFTIKENQDIKNFKTRKIKRKKFLKCAGTD